MKVCVLTLGCKVNSYESEFIKEKFLESGDSLVGLNDNPQVIVINTCSVTNQSDAKSRHLIRISRRECPNAILVAAGCSVQNHRDALSELGVDILLGNKDKSKIVDYVREFASTNRQISKFYDMTDQEFEDMMLTNEASKTRAFVKIQDGCDNFCAYCIIPYLRGNIRSKDIEVAFHEIEELVSKGHKEIVLTGIHTGSYGRHEGYDLVDLIRKISDIPELERIRISSIEITELDEKFLRELANNEKICSHLHVPLQSGDDEILKYMNRKYDTAYYEKKIAYIRSIRPDVSITTDLIVGFPHETDERFENTYMFLSKIGFTKIHSFPFSLRNGTKAEEMTEHFVDESVKKERVHRVLELSKRLENDYYKKFVGTTQDVIIETVKEGKSFGHTSNYMMVVVEDTLEEGITYSIRITSIDEDVVNGVLDTLE